MSELRTSVIVDLAGNLQRRAGRYAQSMKKFTGKSRRYLKGLRKDTKKTTKGFDKMGRRMAALAAGVSMTQVGKQLLNIEERYERLGIQSGMDSGQVKNFKRKIYNTSRQSDIRTDPDSILSAVEEIVEKTGDLKFAEKNLRNIAMAIKATGAEGSSIGGIMAEFQKMGIIDPSEVLEAIDILNVQGKEGAFTLQNLAALGPRVVTAYTALGRKGVPALREMGAALQVIRQGAGSSEMAASTFEALLRSLSDPKRIKMLEKVGVAIFDPEAAKKGIREYRAINDIMKEVVELTKGDRVKVAKLFSEAEAQRAFNAMGSEIQRTGKVSMINKYMDVQASGETIIADSQRMARTGNSQIDEAQSRAMGLLTAITDRLTTTKEQRQKALRDSLDMNEMNQEPSWMAAWDQGGSSNTLADDIGKSVAAHLNDKTATIKLDVDAKGAKVQVKQGRTDGVEVNMDSALQVGGVQ